MKKLQYEKSINAPANKIYDLMLGITNKSTYEKWTAEFNPTSTYEGSWNKGDKMYFIGTDENGKRGGMIAEIAENKPSQFVSIRHYGILDGEKEITSGEQVEKWAGGHENYTFNENNGVTIVKVEVDTMEEYMDYFNNTWPNALNKLKEIAEN
jgi:hypothetical protein